jgi:hypothetical protein
LTNDLFGTLPASMGQLKGDAPTFLMNNINEFPQAIYQLVAVNSSLPSDGLPPGMDVKIAGDNQAYFASGKIAVAVDEFLRNLPFRPSHAFVSG